MSLAQGEISEKGMLYQTIPIAVLKVAVKIQRNQMDRLTSLQITDKIEHIRQSVNGILITPISTQGYARNCLS